MSWLARKGMMGPSGVIYGIEVSLLMHFDGTDGDSIFTDSSSYAKTISVSAGTVTTETEDKVFGTASGLWAATSYLSIPNDDTLRLGTGNFCVDFWMKRSSTGINILLCKGSGSDVYQIYTNSSTLYFYLNGGNITTRTAPTVNAWTHIEWSRTNGVMYFGVGGIITTSPNGNSTNGGSTELRIGRDSASSYYPSGKIDELRIQKGVGGHTSNFTPPMSPY